MTLADPATILITGATGGIGSALAAVYARPGVTLILQGRQPARLQEVAALCRQRGARVVVHPFDLRDHVGWMAWMREICPREGVELVIANAGLNTHIQPGGEGESWPEVEALLAVNIRATMATVYGALPALRQRGGGQIALVSSLAAYYGLPMTPSYCASKAAIKTYGEALRGWLAPEGIRVNVVMPGYVESSMCREMPGPKPFLWDADRAARVIRRGLAKDRSRITFPFPLNLGTWFLSVLPAALSQSILRLLHYRV